MGESAQLIRQRNERAREELASDIDALADRFNVRKQVDRKKDHIVDSIKERFGMAHTHDSATRLDAHSSQGLRAPFTHNKVAIALIGLGAAQLARSAVRHSDVDMRSAFSQTGDSVGAGASDVRQRAGDVAESVSVQAVAAKDAVTQRASIFADRATEQAAVVGDKAGEVAAKATETVSGVADSVKQSMPSSVAEVERTAGDHLTAFGIGAFAAGAIAALLVPRTRFENNRFGEIRETVVDTVQHRAMEAKDAVQSAVEEGLDAAKVGVEQGIDVARSGVEDGVETAKQTAKEALQTSPDDAAATPGPGSTGSRPGRITGSKGLDGSPLSSDTTNGSHLNV